MNLLIEEEMIRLTEEEMILLTVGVPMTVLIVEVLMIPLTEGSLMTLWTDEVKTILLITTGHVTKTSHLPNITMHLPECNMEVEAPQDILKISDIIK